MNKRAFDILSVAQEFWVLNDSAIAHGDSISPYFRVPMHLKLTPPNNRVEFILTDIEATLLFPGFTEETSRTHKICNIDVFLSQGGMQTTVYLEFRLDQNKIAIIEKNRKGPARFSLNMLFRWGIYTFSGTTDTKPWNKRFVSQYDAHYDSIFSIEINPIKWGTEILPILGNQPFRLIEIPSENNLIPRGYEKSLKELDAAKTFYQQGYYDTAVAHCRTALDPFKDVIKDLVKNIPNEKERNWLETMTTETHLWLNKITKATKSLASETHHQPSFGHFDRNEAELIYIITVGIIGYIGRVTASTEQS